MTRDPATPKLSFADLARSLFSLLITLLVMGALLFWPAGTLDWPRAWLFCGAFLVFTCAAIIWILRTTPELMVVRQKFQKGTQAWDAIVASLSVLLFALILPIAGFDYRFGWSAAPDWVVYIGVGLFALGYFGVTWAQSTNRHFEATVRIQTDRDHKVIDTGPYAFIRHPGYAFALPLAAGMALIVGSLFALIPVAIAMLLLAGRTLGEEAVLRKGLPGYTEYAQRVRWRWLPFVW